MRESWLFGRCGGGGGNMLLKFKVPKYSLHKIREFDYAPFHKPGLSDTFSIGNLDPYSIQKYWKWAEDC